MTIHDPANASDAWTTEHALAIVTRLQSEIGKVIVGQQTLIRRLLTALFAAVPFAAGQGAVRAAAATSCSKACRAWPRR